ncbi:hypothetical protein [Anaerofustis butyriciformans]|uniref:hypothetical protein n=1 Tax=Anaerofustis butyriciformans TaxID=3108533 RepID=UPI002E34B2F7|nr:hypothetical protein [Anaerofustis sp. HA2171]
MYKSINTILDELQIILFNKKLNFSYKLVNTNKKRLGTIYDYCSHTGNEISIPYKLFTLSNEDIIKVFIFELLYIYCNNNNIQAFNMKNGYYKKQFKEVGEYHKIQLNYLKNKGYIDVKIDKRFNELILKCNFEDIKSSKEYNKVANSQNDLTQWRYFCPCCNGILRGTKNMKIKCLNCNVEMIHTDNFKIEYQLNNEIIGTYDDKLIIEDENGNLFYIYGNLKMYDIGDCINITDIISIYTLENDDVMNILRKFKENIS